MIFQASTSTCSSRQSSGVYASPNFSNWELVDSLWRPPRFQKRPPRFWETLNIRLNTYSAWSQHSKGQQGFEMQMSIAPRRGVTILGCLGFPWILFCRRLAVENFQMCCLMEESWSPKVKHHIKSKHSFAVGKVLKQKWGAAFDVQKVYLFDRRFENIWSWLPAFPRGIWGILYWSSAKWP